MSCAIIGFGAAGQALAKMFARKGIEVTVATTRSPEAIASQVKTIGSTIVPRSLEDAIKANIIFWPFPSGHIVTSRKLLRIGRGRPSST